MPFPIVTSGATVTCAHAGSATPTASFSRVTVAGQPVVPLTTEYVVVGCVLADGPPPPCASGKWLSGADRVRVGGTPVALSSGASTTTPGGTPLLALDVQGRVRAS